jgi:hypothetical protein
LVLATQARRATADDRVARDPGFCGHAKAAKSAFFTAGNTNGLNRDGAQSVAEYNIAPQISYILFIKQILIISLISIYFRAAHIAERPVSVVADLTARVSKTSARIKAH